jgi:hypothetical protein
MRRVLWMVLGGPRYEGPTVAFEADSEPVRLDEKPTFVNEE